MNDGSAKARWGRVVGDLRREAGLSERRLARETGIDRASLRRIESGSGLLKVSTIELLLAHFGYELDVFQVRAPRPPKMEQKPGPKLKKADLEKLHDLADWVPNAPEPDPAMKALMRAPYRQV